MPVGWIEGAGMQGAGVLRVPVGDGSVHRHILRHLLKQKELNPAPGANRCTFQINQKKKIMKISFKSFAGGCIDVAVAELMWQCVRSGRLSLTRIGLV